MTTLTSSNALEGSRRRARLSALNHITNRCCAGVPQSGSEEDRLGKVQEERAIVVQEEPEAVDKVNKNKVPSTY